MAMKLVDQEEAAKILGVSVEEINALRDRKELFPFRDGSTWKYKVDDLERLKNDRAAGGSGAGTARLILRTFRWKSTSTSNRSC